MACSSIASLVTRRSRSLPRYARLGIAARYVAQPLTHDARPQTWGIGYGMNSASEWQEVAKTALKTAVVLVVLDLLRVTRNSKWFEEHVDFVSVQAVLFNGAARSWWQQTHTLVKLQARLTDD